MAPLKWVKAGESLFQRKQISLVAHVALGSHGNHEPGSDRIAQGLSDDRPALDPESRLCLISTVYLGVPRMSTAKKSNRIPPLQLITHKTPNWLKKGHHLETVAFERRDHLRSTSGECGT